MKLYFVRLQCLSIIGGGPDELSFAYVWADSEEEAMREASDKRCFAIDATEAPREITELFRKAEASRRRRR